MTQIVKTERMGSAWMVTVRVNRFNLLTFRVVLGSKKAIVWLWEPLKRPEWVTLDEYQIMERDVIRAAREASK